VPTDAGNQAKFGLEANVWALHGGWVPNGGLYLTLDASTGIDLGCMTTKIDDGCKAHLRIHWLALGPFFNTGIPMIASEVPRSWDLMALTGAEVRIWKGMTAKATVNWFFPSPWSVYANSRAAASSQANSALGSDASTSTISPASMGNLYRHVGGHPQLNLMARWEF